VIIDRLQKTVNQLKKALTPTPVIIPSSEQLGSVLAQALRDDSLRRQLIAEPKRTLQDMKIHLSPQQSVTVLESTHQQSFFVIPIMTAEEIDQLTHSLTSALPQRTARAKVLLKVRQDREYKARLIADPSTVLRAEGMNIPEETSIAVLENTLEHLYLVLPSVHSANHLLSQSLSNFKI